MNIKRYAANDMRTAIRQVRDDLGADAVILSTHQGDDGVEIVAAVDYDAEAEQVYAAPAPVLPEKPGAGAEASAVKDLRQEMKSLRFLLESQLAQLAWNERTRRSPLQAQAMRNLSGLGLAPGLVSRLMSEVGELENYRDAWQKPLRRLLAHIPVVPQDQLPDSGVIALVGPTGAGKTTAIARLAARHTLAHGRGSLALISADNVRVGARDQLRAYGQILGAPVYVAGDAPELQAAVVSLARTRLVLVDTAGLGHRDPQFFEQTAALRDQSLGLRTFLTLPANAQPEVLGDIIRAYAGVTPEGCVLTKIDEAASLGGALSAVIEANLPLAWLCNGQRVPEDMHAAAARKEWLVRAALERLRESKRVVSEHYMAEHFEETENHADV